MKHFIIAFLLSLNINAQNSFEYNFIKNITFKVYNQKESILHKITKRKEFKNNSPESLVQSYFFANSNEILSSLYLNKSDALHKEIQELEQFGKFKSKDIYVKLLHKTEYEFKGQTMAFLMFIANIKDVPFRFPTVLSIIKNNNKWYIYRRSNQIKTIEVLKNFKPCILSNIFEGKSKDNDIKKIISKVKQKNGGINISRLYDQLVLIQNNEFLNNKLTIAQNIKCNNIEFKNLTTGNIIFTDILQEVKIKKIKKQNISIIEKINKGKDSIILTSSLSFIYKKKSYKLIKYNRISNNKVLKETINLSSKDTKEQVVKNLLTLYSSLKPSIFKDLTPSLRKKPITNSELYKKTRGVYNVLNISKLYELYQTNKSLFIKYIE